MTAPKQSSSEADELRQLAEAIGTISGRCSLEGDRTALIIAATQLRRLAGMLDPAQAQPHRSELVAHLANDHAHRDKFSMAQFRDPIPDAWQWRACIGSQWGAWLDLDYPVERFKERNKFNFDNGTYELRPLYASPPAPLQAGTWTPAQFWEYVEGLTDPHVRDQIRDMLATQGLSISSTNSGDAA